uniref:NADH dehydrogenase subunit 4L n=1 Tax=Breviscolex orientalis TaxID=137570 RepID=A0A343ESQ5_9CEST|nr:NADH dehydrogenase subunit 4L [Breviscolex orientalis]ASL24591.1 NADH dehydrogenase subunit 4L [Breviscolex orientalis]
MMALFLVIFSVVMLALMLSVSRFLNCLVILENFNVLLLLFCLWVGAYSTHMVFVVLMVVTTIEVVVGLVVLTRLWETGGFMDVVGV